MITNLPNLLTLFRIAVIPGIVGLFYLETDFSRYFACAIFSLAAITDFLDGYFARTFSQQSVLGKFLDPVADKLLVSAVLLLMTGFGQISEMLILPTIVILCREIMVSGLREFLAEIRVGLPVSTLAKWKTLIQMLAIGFLIIGDAGPSFLPIRTIGEVALWLAAVLTLITGYDYLKEGLHHIENVNPKQRKSTNVKKK
ncbi:MAG: CDP-diacylglycerol--glycerol-3-phosphate 3-phosphatidyltransferase [Pseudomonadota bacterium]|nr:CDP-diacylglycerol--glycerol-3-phosphate 3-phosphatidyltransferase [Pseudomonadota bacterium]